jgi:hypothetical protein
MASAAANIACFDAAGALSRVPAGSGELKRRRLMVRGAVRRAIENRDGPGTWSRAPARTWSCAHSNFLAWSPARHATSDKDMPRKRFKYQVNFAVAPARPLACGSRVTVTHTRSVARLGRLAWAARVARVVTTREAIEIGIGPPLRNAVKKASS